MRPLVDQPDLRGAMRTHLEYVVIHHNMPTQTLELTRELLLSVEDATVELVPTHNCCGPRNCTDSSGCRLWSGASRKPGSRLGQLFQDQHKFETRKRRTQTHVAAIAECHVLAGITSMDFKVFPQVETDPVAIGRRKKTPTPAPRRYFWPWTSTSCFTRLRQATTEDRYLQALLHRIRNQRRVRHDRVPAPGGAVTG